MSEAKIERIHGDPEQWARDFLLEQLAKNSGRVCGVCVHLEIMADDGVSSGCTTFFNWPSAAQLQGRLQTTVTQLSLKHLGVLP